MRKVKMIIALSIIFIFCISLLSTELKIVGMGGYTSYANEHSLGMQEILFGKETFYKKGYLPIVIDKVELVSNLNQEQTKVDEMYVFYTLRQNEQFTGGQMDYNEFMVDYGENLATVDTLRWLEDERFDIVLLSKEERIENVWIKITYRVAGILKKTVISQEIVV